MFGFSKVQGDSMNFKCIIVCMVFCWNGVIGVVTCYELGGPGIKHGLGEISGTHPDWPWGPRNLLYDGYRLPFPGVKQPGRGINHPPPSSAKVKEGVKLYLYSPFEPSWPDTGWTLSFFSVFCRDITWDSNGNIVCIGRACRENNSSHHIEDASS